jgi:hypothetical protein
MIAFKKNFLIIMQESFDERVIIFTMNCEPGKQKQHNEQSAPPPCHYNSFFLFQKH